MLRLYLHAEEGTPEDMEVATRVGMVITLVATADIMEIIAATSMDGLQRAQQRGVTLRVRILVPLLIRCQRIAPNSARSSGRRFKPKRPRTELSGIHAKLARDVIIPCRNEHRRGTYLGIL